VERPPFEALARDFRAALAAGWHGYFMVISLTPGFSPVTCGDGDVQPLQRLSGSVRSH
jgi:hypothetical protein